MKKIFFFFSGVILLLFIHACKQDDCSFAGKWKVKSIDLKLGENRNLPSGIVEMTKNEYLATSYNFSKDGKLKIFSSGNQEGQECSWKYDKANSLVSWSGRTLQNQDFEIINRVDACRPGEITLYQRMPQDTTQPAFFEAIYVIEKMQ